MGGNLHTPVRDLWRAVAFSCKKRGFCPSCCGRRMADTAGCSLNAPSGPELIRIRADRQPEWTPSSVEGRANDPPGAA